MNHKTIKQFIRIVLAAAITTIGFAAAPSARAETPAGVAQQPTESEAATPVAPAEPAESEAAAPIAPGETSAGETVAPIAPGEPSPGETVAPVISTAEEIKRRRQPKSEIEVGIGKSSADSYKYGDYKGLEKSKPYLITNLLVSRRGEDNASYLDLSGRNLGLDSRNIKVKGGKQGSYGLRFEYDELTRLRSDSYQTPYSGMGTTVLTRPAPWTIDAVPSTPVIDAPVAATIVTPAMMTDLAANMKSFNVQTRRKALGVGVNKTLPDGWYVAASFKREKKDGTKLTGASMQLNATGSRGSVIFPEPINYSTDQFELITRRASEKLNLQFGYYASLFSNANQSTTFDNLYQNSLSSTGGNAATGRIGQMPDNQFHQLNASGGYTLTQATRLNGSLSIGRMTQNQTFLPYTTQNIMPATTSLNGKINTTHADLKLNSRLTHTLNLSAGYKYDDRDNRTAVNQYTYQTADNTLPIAPAIPGNSQTIRMNTPLSNTKQALYADLDYQLAAATKLKLGYDYEKVAHTYEPTTGDRENTVKAEVKHSFGDTASAGLGLARSDRKASSPYDEAGGLQDTYTVQYLQSLCVDPDGAGPLNNTFLYKGAVYNCTGTLSATSTATIPFLNTPALDKYFMADRKRDKLHVFANISPSERLDLQFDANYNNDKYPDNEAGFGLTRAVSWAANFQANLAATDTVSGMFFTTLENYSTDQNGHNGSSSATVPVITTLDRQNNTAAFDPLTGTINRSDRSLALGLGFKVKPGGNYEWGSELMHATTTGSTSYSNIGSRLTTILPLPDVVTRLSRLELFGKYLLQRDMSLNMKYAYEKYASKDWAWDGQTLTSSTAVVGTNQTSPKYNIHMLNVSLSYMF